jgi:hypothetical protein
MADGDYIKLNRAILSWEWYGDLAVRVLFIHILLNCRYQSGRWQGVDLQPGQLPTSLPNLSAGAGLSMQQTRTALKKLSSTGEITDTSTNAYRLITVVKWRDWQGAGNRPATDDQQASNRRSTGQQQHLKKERKKEGKNESSPEGERPVAELPLDLPAGKTPPPSDRRDPNVQAVIDHLTARLVERDIAKSLDGSQKQNRYDAHNLLRKLAKERPTFDPLESAKALIDFATADEFHGRNSTNVGYLLRWVAKIRADAMAKRTTNPKTQSDEQYRASVLEAARARFGN